MFQIDHDAYATKAQTAKPSQMLKITSYSLVEQHYLAVSGECIHMKTGEKLRSSPWSLITVYQVKAKRKKYYYS